MPVKCGAAWRKAWWRQSDGAITAGAGDSRRRGRFGSAAVCAWAYSAVIAGGRTFRRRRLFKRRHSALGGDNRDGGGGLMVAGDGVRRARVASLSGVVYSSTSA